MIINFDKKITDKIWLVKNFISEKEANSIINSVKIDQRNKNGTILIPKLNIINKMIILFFRTISHGWFDDATIIPRSIKENYLTWLR